MPIKTNEVKILGMTSTVYRLDLNNYTASTFVLFARSTSATSSFSVSNSRECVIYILLIVKILQ